MVRLLSNRSRSFGARFLLAIVFILLVSEAKSNCKYKQQSESSGSSDSSSSSSSDSSSSDSSSSETDTSEEIETSTRRTTTTTTHRTTTTTTTQPPLIICCGEREAPRGCINPCTENLCSNRGRTICPEYCKKGPICDCEAGYRRDKCGKCIREKDCDLKCTNDTIPICFGPNETADGCFNPHKERTCSNLKKKLKHDPNDLCVMNTCHCIDGFVRNKYKECVHPSKCKRKSKKPKIGFCAGPNEEPIECFKKSNAKICPERKKTSKHHHKKERCQRRKCDCVEGYLRNDSGVCVRKKECSAKITYKCTNPCQNKNEIYRCVNACIERLCKNIGRLAKCSNKCVGKCDCKPGYYRDDNTQICVPKSKCPKVQTENPEEESEPEVESQQQDN